MADALDVSRETAQAARLRADAEAAAAAVLSSTLVAASQRAIAAVAADGGGGALGEPAADLRQIRTDSAVLAALAHDRQAAIRQAAELIGNGLWQGYRLGLKTRSKGLPVRTEETAADQLALESYPVQGFTVAEIAADLGDALVKGVNQALAAPLVGTIDAQTIPAALQAVALAHAARVGAGVEEAHAVGIAAAVRVIGAALVQGRAGA